MIVERQIPRDALARLEREGVPPLLARLLAARGVAHKTELSQAPSDLLPPDQLAGIDTAANRLADAIAAREPIIVVADYDCDGATACATMVRGLRAMGAVVDYLVPNRFEHGYGLTPPIVALALAHPRLPRPRILVTVDNGIASLDGVDAANAAGLDVVVTDHHLPADRLPAARAIVNPNQPGCPFPSKNLAGVGVAFYLLLALRATLRTRGAFDANGGPALQALLDLVALGTVADVVRLDRNNRILVAAGLKRIRGNAACAGIRALLSVAGRETRRCTATDLGFAVGPRINAAGRMADITLGIECLLSDDETRAHELAEALDAINRERRSKETEMRDEALAGIDGFDASSRLSFAIWRDGWHEGVVGLVASRLKDRLHRPAFAFAPAGDAGRWRGSGRSIPGVHLRDVLDLVAKRHPGLIERFGGHAMAAGLTVPDARLAEFPDALDAAVAELADPACFELELLTDGPLPDDAFGLDAVEQIEAQVWGQGFPEPVFSDEFEVKSQRLLKDRHLKLALRRGGRTLSAIWFDRREPLPGRCRLAYRLQRDDWTGGGAVQLLIVAADD